MAEREKGQSTGTVLVALASNAGIAVAKGFAAIISGSAAMAAETAHSVVDTANELLLLLALRRSEKPADRAHPFGYGPERFFWAFVAAVSIFVSGAVFAAIEGIRTLMSPSQESRSATVSYAVLGVSFLLEGVSWVTAMRQVRGEAATHRQSFAAYLSSTDDPTVKTVFFEDSAALVGLVLAAAGVYVHEVTGSSAGDAVASLLIAALLASVAYLLARTNKGLLIGSQADPRLLRAIGLWIADRPEVDALVDLMTQRIGTGRLLVCARVDFVDDRDGAGLERTVLAMNRDLRGRFSDVAEVFLEPVPRSDQGLRDDVRERYGDRIAQAFEDTAGRG